MSNLTHFVQRATALSLLASLFVAVRPAQAATPPEAIVPGVNLLTNPSHEHPGAYFAQRGEINVTWNWTPYWEESPPGTDSRDQNYRTPEFRPPFARDYPYRVHSGGGSDRWFNYFALNKKAGIMQYVENVPIGSRLRFTSWLQLWSSNDNDPAIPPKSSRDGNLQVRLCIDQDGGVRDMNDPEMVCSDWAQPYDKWAQLSVDGIAKNSVVNVIMWSTAAIPVEHNDIYADDSCLEILPTADAAGICKGAGYIPSAPGLTGASQEAAGVKPPANVADILAGKTVPVTTKKATVAPKALSAVPVPAGDKPAAAVNAANTVNLRAQPSTTAKVLGKAKRGDVLTVAARSSDGKWFQVSVGSTTGWVLASLTKPNSAAKSVPTVGL